MKIVTNYKETLFKFKNNFPNIYILIISIAIVAFFKGMTGLLTNITFNSNSVEVNLLLIILAIAILYSNDGSLSELYNLSSGTAAAAGVTANTVVKG